MNDQIVRIGIVGFGRIVELVHLPLIRIVPELAITGIYDITPERLELAAKRKLPIFHTIDELLNSDADALLIATPPSSHYELASRAMASGKHVIVEKPVSLRADEALELQSIAARTGTSITVFHNRRYDADYAAVKHCLNSGILGNLQFIERRIHRMGSGASFAVKSFDPEWRNKPEYGGGALLDWGVHLIDQLLRLELGQVRDVHAHIRTLPWNQGRVDDYVHANLVLDNGVSFIVDINFASHAAEPQWIVGGEHATLIVQSEREAWIRQAGGKQDPYPINPPSRYAALPIYQNLAAHILHDEPLSITIEQAVETMKLLERIRGQQKETVHANSILIASSGVRPY